MGDAGSGFLGFMMGVFVVLSSDQWGLSVAVPLILLATFIVDATVTLARRLLGGDRWYEAHKSHGYQRLSRVLNSHRAVTFGALAINVLWLLPLAIVAALRADLAIYCALIAFLPLVAIALWIGRWKV
jgi:Fuc2NAc and GlcNAc transferase